VYQPKRSNGHVRGHERNGKHLTGSGFEKSQAKGFVKKNGRSKASASTSTSATSVERNNKPQSQGGVKRERKVWMPELVQPKVWDEHSNRSETSSPKGKEQSSVLNRNAVLLAQAGFDKSVIQKFLNTRDQPAQSSTSFSPGNSCRDFVEVRPGPGRTWAPFRVSKDGMVL